MFQPTTRPAAFANMNRFKALDPDASAAGYRAWKQKDDPKATKKEINLESSTDFPELVGEAKKKTVFEGLSLAAKLKETIAAEEEAAILKRLKKGETPEMILRESCVILPLKGGHAPTEPFEVPWWVTDTSDPIIIPAFKHKTLEQLAEERKWRRLGIRPQETMLFDEDTDSFDDDKVSMPAIDMDTLSDTSSVGEPEQS